MTDKIDWITQGIKISCKQQKCIILNTVNSYVDLYKKIRINTTVDLQQI
jgi:hypothetical protein